MLRFAMAALVVAGLNQGFASPAAAMGLPEGKVAVIRVSAIDGLAKATGEISQNRTSAFTFDGTTYALTSSSVTSLDGVEVLLLIDRRRDEASAAGVVQSYSQEARAIRGSTFTVGDLSEKQLQYQLAMIGGNLRLLGAGDQIVARGGAMGPYHIWKITGMDLVNKEAIVLR